MPTRRMKISYDRGVVKKLMQEFKVSDNTVRNALKFTTTGEQPDAIRDFALKYLNCHVVKEVIVKLDK